VAVFEKNEANAKALAKAIAAIASPSEKVVSEIEFFEGAAEVANVDLASLSPVEIVAWQTALFFAWQDSAGRDAEIANAKAEREAKAAIAKLDRLDAEAEADAERERKNAREAARLADRKAEREALRAKFASA
jgi:hypothetical protein